MHIHWKRRTVGIGVLTLALVGALGASHDSLMGLVWAQQEEGMPTTAEPTAETEETAAPAAEQDDGLERYSYGELFSIGIPSGWQATEQDGAPQVILAPGNEEAAQAEGARIEITWYEQPPQVVVAQALSDLKASGHTVTRYTPQDIDGTTAINIWLANLPDAMPNAFMSYIGYDDSTAAVISYYGDIDPQLETLLGNIHTSFERLD